METCKDCIYFLPEHKQERETSFGTHIPLGTTSFCCCLPTLIKRSENFPACMYFKKEVKN